MEETEDATEFGSASGHKQMSISLVCAESGLNGLAFFAVVSYLQLPNLSFCRTPKSSI